ncbi:MAG: bis(5'-nucleosyl)-tetraphosphatase (symmetrical) [Candidatus Dactylopiibacterium carminicum]|uniref:bis(5'-nucleosyl)-tetraphosphatase (symmetrical) n=1 Tax=Candidatus Dactylopiibacterium carminicum TaxID=857335 RepID=A0A272ERG5_9RHOO|nr:symmetrical bis(5'-nucleosyl)-tetraphosphatase [Candidatus Dactylopiibacterium carminicum]KAF7598799.1 symmetrical bis(5'-nucleosyl)-tetraphosphatase [Candidatus Dactylopiibacterium carminicum]PAS92674.1 MAG: bis(5'-nucleosyl)-tetraphosphatase (symmetrical) [Candidatus Dactylopiibacterium carminicum]PAS94717.1 MAG: bis(5'-nucleosyl)-tetraphosphatase (symmetrical) [Candidatus Dactylopiibacterium carminicum]PAS98819.1 MAG: bis(5'-nucleosyl)-tetraphosphatase (symmetrical) [Candidatus Dactylopii
MTPTRYRYAIGDIQGCPGPFEELLQACDFDPALDRLWIAGDLVNRGPGNIEVLRRIRALGERASCVLGNHDFYFLAVVAGAVQRGEDDTLQDLLDAPDCAELTDWLRRQPLMHAEDGFAMVHAGLLPEWSVDQALALAKEAETALRADDWRDFLRRLWGGKPDRWQDDLAGADRLRVIVNTFCRLRFLTPDGRLALKAKGLPESAPDFVPWFDFPQARWRTHTVIHGHWSALGFRDMGAVIALDSGCVWGGSLTAMRLEDRRVWQVGCPQAAAPTGWD